MKHRILRTCGIILAAAIVLATTAAAAPTACNILYTITPQNATAFGASITIENTGTTAITSWSLTWAFANGQTISSLWDGVETQSGANVTVTNESYNGTIAAGGNVAGIGFNGTWNGTTNAVPTAFSLSGTACSVNGVAPGGGGSFSLKPSAATLSIAQSASGTDTITITDVSPFAGSVTLAATGLSTGVTAAWGTNPATSTSVLTLTASSTATTGTSTVTVTGTSGSLSATTTISLTVTAKPGFTLTPAATTESIAQSKSVTDAITVTDLGGFTGAVTLTASSSNTGVTVTVSGTTLTIAASSTASGTATITVTGTGTSGTTTLTATTTIAVTVTSSTASFTLVPSLTSCTMPQGGSCTVTITVTPANGFSGSVALAASGLPTGVTATFGTNPATTTSVVTFTAATTAAVGSATVTLTGTSGTLTATTTITIIITAGGSFSLTPSSTAVTAAQGSSFTDTITIKDVSPFAGSVTLAATGCTFSPNPATTTSVMTCSVSSSATVGTSTITITGTSSTLTASTTISLTVTAATSGSFTLGTSSSTMSVVQGSTATDTITVTDVNGFTGSVTLAASGLPTGVTAAFATNPTTATSVITLTASSTAATGAATITITGTSGTLTATTPIAVTVLAASSGMACGITYTVTAQSSTSFGGAFVISNTGTTAWTSWTLTWAFANGQTITSFWNGVETQSGGNVTVASESYNGAVAAGGSASNIGFDATWNSVINQIPASFSINGTICTLAPQTAGNFTLAGSSSALTLVQGGTATDTITVTDVGTSVGDVSLSASGLPSGVTAAFGTNPTLSTSVLTLTASSTATTGASTVTITGTNGSGTVTATTTIALTVSLPQPIISWVSPSSGIAGSSMNIMPGGALGDASYGATQGTSVVYFGTTAATVTSWAVNGVQVTVPSLAAGSYNVTVVVNGVTSNAVPFTVASATPSPVTYTGNSTWFSALGTPYGGCGVPQQYLDSQYFVALNVQNDPGNYTLFLSRPISSTYASYIGLWDNGQNCGRWVHITIGDFCVGTNDGMQDAAFCRGNTGWVADQFNGAQLDLVVADSCQDGNAWCRDDPDHLDQAEGALNEYVLNGAAVGDMNPTYWNNRQISWYFELPPSYTGDINIGVLAGTTATWGAVSITHLANGIHGLQYLVNGVWTTATNDGDMGEAYLVLPTTTGGTTYEIQVYDITNTLINSGRIYTFTYPTSCGTDCTAAFTPVTYTTSQ